MAVLLGVCTLTGHVCYAEHKYCNLIARQGWASAILDVNGAVMTSAHGRTPWWAVGIHAAELWALLNFHLMPFLVALC